MHVCVCVREKRERESAHANIGGVSHQTRKINDDGQCLSYYPHHQFASNKTKYFNKEKYILPNQIPRSYAVHSYAGQGNDIN